MSNFLKITFSWGSLYERYNYYNFGNTLYEWWVIPLLIDNDFHLQVNCTS